MRSAIFICHAIFAASLALAPVASAEEAKGPEAAVVGAGIDLTAASLQARIRKIEAAHPSPDELTAASLREYAAAVDQLELAAEWRQRGEALSRLQREGPQTLASLRRELDAWNAQVQPAVPADASQAELEAMLAETEAKLAVVRKNLGEVDGELAQLGQRRLALPAELAAAGAAREESAGGSDVPPLPTGSVDATLSRRASQMALQRASAEQAAALELELATQELRRELLTARRDLLQRKIDTWAARAGELQKALAARRLREAEETAEAARADQASLARVHPILGSLAAENARLTAERAGEQGVTAKLEATSRRLAAVSEQLARLEERSKGVRQKVAAAGLTDAIGLLLRKEKGELPDVDRVRADIRARRAEISDVQLETLNLEDLLRSLPAAEAEVEKILREQQEGAIGSNGGPAPSDGAAPKTGLALEFDRNGGAKPAALAPEQRERIAVSARNVLKTRRTYLDALIRDSNAYFAVLVDLDAKETELVRLLDDYHAFLDQHVLWIPNTTPPDLRHLGDWRDAVLWLVDPGNYVAAGVRLADGLRATPIRSGFALVLLLSAAIYRRRLRHLHAEICRSREVPGQPQVPAPVAVLVISLLLAAPGPFAVWFGGWLLRVAPTPPDDFSAAASSMLAALAFPFFVAELNRRATSPSGAVACFLDWPRAPLALARRQITFMETFALPCFAVAALLDAQPHEDWSETVGRTAFCLAVGAFGFAAHRLFSPAGRFVEQVLRRTDLEWMRPFLARASWLPSTIAAGLILIAMAGYYYTAFVLVQRLWLSALVMLVFILTNASALRWLAWKEQATAREALAGEEAVDATAAPGEEVDAAEAIARVSTQTRSLLRLVFGIAAFLALFSVWADVFPALRFFEKVELYEVSTPVERTVGTGDATRVEMVPTRVPVTVANLLVALLAAMLAFVGARNLPGLIELAVLSRLHVDRGLRYAIAAVTRYVVFVAGTIVALRNLGVEWSNVQWLVAAISVGLGFGLQEIFGNFVSGLIVLFERPVRVGDTVTIDNVTGTVMRIEMRATTILDGDRKELIVPNKELITGKLLNWSLRDSTVRLVIPIAVAYGTDPSTVVRVLQECAKQCATVLEQPPPLVVFTKFGDSALEFELRVFLTNPDDIGTTRHDLLVSIDRRFRAASIEMPFPQRDVHLRSVDAGAAAALGVRPPEPA